MSLRPRKRERYKAPYIWEVEKAREGILKRA